MDIEYVLLKKLNVPYTQPMYNLTFNESKNKGSIICTRCANRFRISFTLTSSVNEPIKWDKSTFRHAHH